MAVQNGSRGKLAVAGLGTFDVGMQAAGPSTGAKYQIALPALKNGRALLVGQTVQLDGEQLKVLHFAPSAHTRGFVTALLGPVAA